LSDRDKALLTMAYEEGLTYQEMGRRLGVPPATCGTWLYRARQRCKHYLTLPEGGYPHENDPPHSPRGQ
ncbi:MAG: sigma-70 family RNA polymerase sigma factor, partial [Evtepia sp.]|nr:sigma-70 family RNA polymerase sigma factor [Evtepia sp.]